MSSPTQAHPSDVLVTIAALQDQIEDLVAVVQAQQRQIDAHSMAIASGPGRP